MEPVAIPKTIDDPIHLLLWSADEIVPFMVCMLTGMLIDQFIPALAIGVIAVKFYRRFRDNRPDGYTLHAIYWLGLLPSKAITIPNPFIRRFSPCGSRSFCAPGKGMRPRTGSAASLFWAYWWCA